MRVTIRQTGIVKMIDKIALLGSSGKAIKGDIATFISRVPYAMPVERVWRKGSGGARMFERGVAATVPFARRELLAALPGGVRAVGQAKKKIRDRGIEEIRKRTPVRTGRLRNSVTVIERTPIPAMDPPLPSRR